MERLGLGDDLRRRYLAPAVAATAAFFVLGGATAAELVGSDQVCASATASTPDHVIGQAGPTLDGQQLPAATYTIPGSVATDTQCVTIPTVTVTAPGTTTEEPPPPPPPTTTEAPPPTTTSEPPPTTTTAPPPPPPPARLVLWGSSTPPNHTSTRETEARWIEDHIGRKLGITRHYLKAPSAWTGDSASTSVTNGRNVMITFTSGGDTWNQVANGSLDSYVRTQVNELEARGGLWNDAYIAFENEPEAEGFKGSAADYVRAYEHLIQVGNAAGMPAHWTTALMEYSWQSGSGRNPEAWVPNGIDTLGVHVYFTRVGTCGDGVRSFASGVDDPYRTAVAHNLRMGIWEMGYSTKAGTSPDLKANFFRSIPSALANFPRIDAMTYWNQGSTKCGDANSYYIDSSTQALQGYSDAGHTEILGG